MPRFAALLLAIAPPALAAWSADPSAPENPSEERPAAEAAFDAAADARRFAEQFRPFLAKHCQNCHGPDRQEGDLRVDALTAEVAAGRHAKPWAAILERLRAGEMPPEDVKARPAAAEIEALTAWLAPRVAARAARSTHWAFQPLRRPAGGSIDGFVERRLAASGLGFAPRAEPARLLRRLHYDLIGLPPTPEETVAFVADPSPERYAEIVDRLLASPRHGERWGRFWLDLARHADSNGLHEDGDRPQAWRYRDYVIASFNADKPYGDFIREQLAGDELAPHSAEAWIATGFCRGGPSNEENVAANEVESYRLDQFDDVLATTTQVFLGQSIGCARCHDHKLEPFTQRDYYRLLAVFDQGVSAEVPLLGEGRAGEPRLLPIKPRDTRKPSAEAHARALTDLAAAPRVTRVLYRGNPATPGDVVAPGTPGALAGLSVPFQVVPRAKTTGRRAALAEWIASPANGLTWRVMANRLWQHHFGKGLVATPSNLGESGAPPSHLDLLEWLACELRDNGGHLKPLHRRVALSRAYQQSSGFRPGPARVDPENSLVWRYSPRRLEAEAIRDAVLAASGNLNLEMGGPGVKPRLPVDMLELSKRNAWPNVARETEVHWRRGVYVYRKRQLPMPMLALFDAPDAAQSCAERFASTTPTQALVLLNDPFVNEQALALARRVLSEHAPDDGTERGSSAAAAHDGSAAWRVPARALLERAWALPVSNEQAAEAAAFVAERIAARQVEGAADGAPRTRPRAALAELALADLALAELALADLAVVAFNASQFVYLD